MPKKEIINVSLAVANPNLSPATRFGTLVFVSGQTGRHPVTGELGKDIREQTRNTLVTPQRRFLRATSAAGASPSTIHAVQSSPCSKTTPAQRVTETRRGRRPIDKPSAMCAMSVTTSARFSGTKRAHGRLSKCSTMSFCQHKKSMAEECEVYEV